MRNGKMKTVDAQITLKGVFTCRVYKHVNGEKRLEGEFKDNNLIVRMAKVQMAHLVAGDFDGHQISQIGFGTNNAKPEMTDTGLTEAYIKGVERFDIPDVLESLEGIEYPVIGVARFFWTLERNEANGMAISEFGLFCKNGVLFARKRREDLDGEPLPPVNKESDISLEGTWQIEY